MPGIKVWNSPTEYFLCKCVTLCIFAEYVAMHPISSSLSSSISSLPVRAERSFICINQHLDPHALFKAEHSLLQLWVPITSTCATSWLSLSEKSPIFFLRRWELVESYLPPRAKPLHTADSENDVIFPMLSIRLLIFFSLQMLLAPPNLGFK